MYLYQFLSFVNKATSYVIPVMLCFVYPLYVKLGYNKELPTSDASRAVVSYWQ